MSAPLLVLFPILIQLGFVFIGAQAGRLLDIAGIKASFPRIMAGFSDRGRGRGPARRLARLRDRPDGGLLLATAVAQATFAGLVLATGRRYPAELADGGRGGPRRRAPRVADDARPPPRLRRLLRSRFVALILAYQVLSALGSQLADFLVFDRATAQYPATADLAGFMAGYTAVMNVGGHRLPVPARRPAPAAVRAQARVAANPFVVTILAVGMLVVLALSGAGSLALLAIVSATRIADIALTDGTTRTSINALYQVLPGAAACRSRPPSKGSASRSRSAISGVLILVINALPAALVAMIVVTILVCGVWTWVAVGFTAPTRRRSSPRWTAADTSIRTRRSKRPPTRWPRRVTCWPVATRAPCGSASSSRGRCRRRGSPQTWPC